MPPGREVAPLWLSPCSDCRAGAQFCPHHPREHFLPQPRERVLGRLGAKGRAEPKFAKLHFFYASVKHRPWEVACSQGRASSGRGVCGVYRKAVAGACLVEWRCVGVPHCASLIIAISPHPTPAVTVTRSLSLSLRPPTWARCVTVRLTPMLSPPAAALCALHARQRAGSRSGSASRTCAL